MPYLQSRLPGLNPGDLGTLYPALSANLPGDRMGHTHFWKDLNYSSYSYERFYPDIILRFRQGSQLAATESVQLAGVDSYPGSFSMASRILRMREASIDML